VTNQGREYAWFVAAQVITFSFIALLQLVEGWLFLLFLVAMHTGVFMLIWSKKRLMSHDVAIKRYYDRVYLHLALYVPLLLYRLVGLWVPYCYNEKIAQVALVGILVISVAGAIHNCLRLYAYLFRGSVAHARDC